MDSLCLSNDSVSGFKDKESMVDPFLVEALQNPRHRLTILRMELDIQRFLNNADQQHFEFQHFPSSYLRLAAHRVAQHYNMQTMVQDNGLDGQGSKILVRKLPESKPYKTSLNEANEAGMKGNPVRSVEERKEEYDRARARIFSGSRSSDSCDTYSLVSMDGKNSSTSTDENETSKNPMTDSERCINVSIRDNSSTRVAIFRDREKDRSDPDYDRSYGRYARSIPTSAVNLVPFNLQKAQHSFAQYDTAFNQLGQMPQTQASLGFGPPSSPIMSPFCTTGLNQASRDGAYLQWPSAAMMYAHSYDQFRHAVFQAPFGQQPLSFDYSQDY
ncbi:R3H domain-containing protein 1 isoform X2 [Abrus precatorius]|uniref:R3H domain-containing protein 1 isoform X2 n=1 Tax=Abrus precatorius TaxID=3816 RepID=A0A8B8L1V5_ABRPR|nr:R3H domain-containing protein 1 isoform X2 [Abrus precatorius]